MVAILPFHYLLDSGSMLCLLLPCRSLRRFVDFGELRMGGGVGGVNFTNLIGDETDFFTLFSEIMLIQHLDRKLFVSLQP